MESTENQVQESRPAAPKVVVLPGEEIAVGSATPGQGTYNKDGRVFASILGLKIEHQGTVSVVPLSGVYIPRQGDTVIGSVIDLGPSNWTVDIRSSSPAPLHVNDVPWKVDFGDTARYIAVGETVLLKIFKIDEVRRVFLTLSGPGLRKLEGGEVVEVAHTKVSRVVGKGGATIEKVKRWTNCRIFAARNGRVWVDGELDDMVVAIRAIKLIETEADSPNLTATVDAFLKQYGREPAAAPEAAPADAAPKAASQGFEIDEGEDDETRRREARAKEEE